MYESTSGGCVVMKPTLVFLPGVFCLCLLTWLHLNPLGSLNSSLNALIPQAQCSMLSRDGSFDRQGSGHCFKTPVFALLLSCGVVNTLSLTSSVCLLVTGKFPILHWLPSPPYCRENPMKPNPVISESPVQGSGFQNGWLWVAWPVWASKEGWNPFRNRLVGVKNGLHHQVHYWIWTMNMDLIFNDSIGMNHTYNSFFLPSSLHPSLLCFLSFPFFLFPSLLLPSIFLFLLAFCAIDNPGSWVH